LAPLSRESAQRTPAGLPEPDPGVSKDLQWWETVRIELAAFAPAARDASALAIAETLGLTAAQSPYVDPDPELADVLIAGAKAGQEQIEQLAKGGAPPPSGWISATHYFDHNTDHLGVGTIDAPGWRIEDRNTAYATRAAAARAGLYGNHGYEANYEIVYVDAEANRSTAHTATNYGSTRCLPSTRSGR
jgi:hypothetical protein